MVSNEWLHVEWIQGVFSVRKSKWFEITPFYNVWPC